MPELSRCHGVVVRMYHDDHAPPHFHARHSEFKSEGEIDLAGALRGPVFELLEDPAYFASFTLDLTLTWPSGADFAPESLYQRVLRTRRSA